MRLSFCAVTVAALTLTSHAGAAVKPWQWTTGQAAAQLVAWSPAVLTIDTDAAPATVRSARCAGVGKAVARRYLAFRCATVFSPSSVRLEPVTRTVFVKVRRQGKGQPCVSLASLASVPAGCLAPAGVRAKGSEPDARAAIRAETRYLGRPACVGFGAGFYRCEWEGQRAVVVFKPAAAVTLI